MKTDRRTVLVLTSTFPRYEGDTMPPFVLRLCQAMQGEGWESIVLAPHALGLKTDEMAEGVRCHRFRYAPEVLEQLAYGGGMLANVREAGWRWLLLPFYLLFLLLHALFFVFRSRTTVVHAHWVVPQGLVAAILKKLPWRRSLRFVMTAHGGDLQTDMGGLMGRVLLWSMRQADVLAVVSEAMRQRAIQLGMPADRIVVASMGVDVGRFCPPSSSQSRHGVLFVGRLVEKKGVTYLLEAFRLVLASKPDLRLTIVGDGPLRAGLEQQAARSGIAQSVDFLGACPPDKVPAFFQQARVFAMSSIIDRSGDQEGLGLVAAEAMACLCPVVAHDLAAVRDLVTHENTGLLVPAGDVEALARALCRLLDDEGLAARLATAARLHVRENYAWQAVAQRYAGIYSGAPCQYQSSPDAL